jgi:Carbamoyl-phosphate synthase L chain, ATP binding domain
VSKTVLLLSLSNWFGSARLPKALNAAGFEVGILAEPTSLIAQSRFVGHRYPISVARTRIGLLAPIVTAIEEFAPALVLPADENAARLISALASGKAKVPASVRRRLQASVGSKEDGGARYSRRLSRDIARACGILASPSRAIKTISEAATFAGEFGWPVVLKREGTAGGAGVRICHSADELETAWRELQSRRSERPSTKSLAHHAYWAVRSGFTLAGDLCEPDLSGPEMSVEAYIAGQPAYCTAAVMNGKLLAAVSVRAITTHPAPNGPSTAVKSVDSPVMEHAASALVAELGFTGFCGLDFIICAATGRPYFLEFNARATPVVHLGALFGTDLCDAFGRALDGLPARSKSEARPLSVALFPQDWLRAPVSQVRRAEALDVPFDDPALLSALRELLPPSADVPAMDAPARLSCAA